MIFVITAQQIFGLPNKILPPHSHFIFYQLRQISPKWYKSTKMENKPELKLFAGILGLCLIAFVVIDEPTYQSHLGGRRSLAQLLKGEQKAVEGNSADGIYSWAKDHLASVTEFPSPREEQGIFWHISKEEDSTVKDIFDCFHKHVLVMSQPEDVVTASYKRRLVQSGEIDIITTSYPEYAVEKLLEHQKGRMVALFRHPIDRLTSKFYYLQVADWERTYSPEWKDMTVYDWALNTNVDNNAYVKRLAGKRYHDMATEEDLQVAKHTIKYHFIVGITDKMEESVRRFNEVLGIDDSVGNNARCMKEYFETKESGEFRNGNSYSYPKLEKYDPGYKLLAKQNSLDIQLYEYVEGLFKSQGLLIDQYKFYSTSETVAPLTSEAKDGSFNTEILELPQGDRSNGETHHREFIKS